MGKQHLSFVIGAVIGFALLCQFGPIVIVAAIPLVPLMSKAAERKSMQDRMRPDKRLGVWNAAIQKSRWYIGNKSVRNWR